MTASTAVLGLAGLDRLVGGLIERGYRVVGPVLRDSAIVLDELRSAADLPSGWTVEAGPGHYTLRRRDDGALFGHSAGPQSWKKFLHPPRRRLWSSDAPGEYTAEPDDRPPYAFLGVRGCDLAAMGILDTAIACGGAFVVAVHCAQPSGVCFCASMGTGPRAGPGHDLALTELIDDDGHRFLAEAGSERGAELLAALPRRAPAPAELDAALAQAEGAARSMGRRMPEGDLPELLRRTRESPHWQDVASRCLTCANCTMVCPTCFCTSTEDVSDLTGEHAERWQHWASCFELDFSYVHGGSVRQSGASRYRQWLSHKLGTWHDQFGTSGCVGCGRCIAWCPAGIDITAEVAALSGEGAPVTWTPERIADLPIFAQLSPAERTLVARAARDVHYPVGRRLFSAGEPAHGCWIVHGGLVALDMPVPGRGDVVIQTLGAGDLLGWSWLVPPFQWHFGAITVEPVGAALLDTVQLRALAEQDPRFGHLLTLSLFESLLHRLQATRSRLLDLYGEAGEGR